MREKIMKFLDGFININSKYSLVSYLLMFILIFVMLIQLNITNQYISILFGSLLGMLSDKEKSRNV